MGHPEAVTQLAFIDVIPGLDFYELSNAQIAQDYFYFSFLTQDHPLPETLIAVDAVGFVRLILLGLSNKVVQYDDLALEAYLTCNQTPEAIAAKCECFRAGFHVDRKHDQID
ncbi:hypothetical protein [Ahrensia sp. R2A130]|uniref:hypothetical protein n=1 Tax=Ahrensia sp. R2A130 TaxID=744979 RepID=UPI0001E0E037|nr:hypothetical protein [Ahrensia sp. R2A130]EFL90886.1 alpha/beta hydrolase fold protein [Ahrensia sp. R2A130]